MYKVSPSPASRSQTRAGSNDGCSSHTAPVQKRARPIAFDDSVDVMERQHVQDAVVGRSPAPRRRPAVVTWAWTLAWVVTTPLGLPVDPLV